MNTAEIFDLGQIAEAVYGNFVDSNGLITRDIFVQNILQGLKPDPITGQLVAAGTGM